MILLTDATSSPSSSSTKPIRVLHIFAPNYKHRFGGPIFDWKYAFSAWNDPTVQHFVLDSKKGKLIESREAFDFPLSTQQYIASRWERFTWIFDLYRCLLTQKDKFDILHVHVPWWGGFLSGLWASRHGIPSIYQSVLLNEDTPSGLLRERLGKFQVRALREFNGILAISDSLAKDYLDHNFSPNQVFTLMNPVDSERFHTPFTDSDKTAIRSKIGLSTRLKVLLFVGSLIHRKGVDTLIHAFRKAVKSAPDLYLMLVGADNTHDNPSLDMDFVNRMKSLVQEFGLADQVTFRGLEKDRSKLAELYQAADIFVFPSRNEGMPNVVLEAMACGLPTIVSHLPVLESVIHHGENGIFVPVDDVNSLADAIIQLAANPALCQSLGQAANRYTITHHGFANWQARLAELYRNLLREV